MLIYQDHVLEMPERLDEAITYLQEVLREAKLETNEPIYLEIEAGDYETDVKVSYQREETQEEITRGEERNNAIKREKLAGDRVLYERLKERFEPS